MYPEQVHLLIDMWRELVKLTTPLISPAITVITSLWFAKWLAKQEPRVKPPKK